MDRINTPTKAVDLFGAGKHGFKNGDLALGIIPTDCNAEFFNAIQEELLAVIEGNSIVPDAGSQNQLYQAILAMIAAGKANDYKASVRAATTAEINLAAPGATIDDVAMVAGDRFLDKDHTTGNLRGIYIWNGAAVPATRATDADGVGELTSGAIVAVEEGTINSDSQWMLTTDGTITIGTTALTFVRKDASAAATGFRNKIINGSMAVDQRNLGSAQTFTAGAALAYCVDRWYGYCTGANVSGQRVAGSGANQYKYQFSGGAGVTKIGFAQRIEKDNCIDLAGSTATLSVDLANSLLTTVNWVAYYANTGDTFGTLASPTRTQIATGSFTVDSTLKRYSTQISVPSAAITGIEVEFSVGGQINGTWDIGNVQLERGSAATLFERLPYGQRLALCQRYFQRWGDVVNAWQVQAYASAGSQNPACSFTFPVSMRIAPTNSLVGLATFTNASGINANTPTPYGGFLYLTSSGVGTSAAYCSGAGNYFKFEAEL